MRKGVKIALNILGITGVAGTAGYLGYKKGLNDGLTHGAEEVNKVLRMYQEEEKAWKENRTKELVVRQEMVIPTQEDIDKVEELLSGDEEPVVVDIPEPAPEKTPEEKRKERKRKQPYFIESSDYDSGMINYDKVSLVVFAEDQTVCTDDMHTLYDSPELIKGVLAKMCKFPDEYFVRNDSALTDFDITVINGSYSEEA